MALDALFPEWGLWTQFIADDQAVAMRLDALKSSHPIQVPIKRAEECEEVFDAISYCKGASVSVTATSSTSKGTFLRRRGG